MTNEEAAKIIKSECYIADLLNLDRIQMVNTALDLAIKALEQQSFIDKIRAEIEAEPYISKMEVLDIIDKYKAESEDKE